MQHIFSRNEQKRLLLLFVLALAAGVPILAFRNIPPKDSALYALLAHEFSVGNFAHAFSITLPPLLTTLGGILNVFIHDAFAADKIVCFLFFLFGIPGTYLLAREIRGEKVAFLAATLYTVCPYTLDLATSGGVDAGKLALLPWLIWTTYKWCQEGGLKWGTAVGILGGLISLARGEGLFFALFALILFTVSRCRKTRNDISHLVRSCSSLLVAIASLLVIISPWMIYEAQQTGFPVTNPCQIMLYQWYQDLHREINAEANAATGPPPIRVRQKAATNLKYSVHKPDSARFWVNDLRYAARGSFPPFLYLAVFGVIYQYRRERCLAPKDWFPLGFLALNFAIFFPDALYSPDYVSCARYYKTTIPLYLHFSALGLIWLETTLARRRFFSPKRIVICWCLFLLVYVGLAQKRSDLFMNPIKFHREMTVMAIGHWIAAHRKDFPTYSLPNGTNHRYHNGRSPIILTLATRVAYYATADVVQPLKTRIYTPQEIVRMCQRDKVSLVLYGNELRRFCPALAHYWPNDPHFTAIDTTPGFPKHSPQIRLLEFHVTPSQ